MVTCGITSRAIAPRRHSTTPRYHRSEKKSAELAQHPHDTLAAQIKQNVHELGKFTLITETTAASGDSYDGHWEVSYLLGQRENLLQEMGKDEVSEKEVAAMVAMFDSVKAGVDGLAGDVKKVKTMDWWGGVFEYV